MEGSLQNKMAIFIPSIVHLPADVLPYIFRNLDGKDMISFASTCEIFRQMCVDAKVFRKIDLSRQPVSSMQRGEINKFFWDRQLTQHIKELDVSNLHVLNWQMDDHLIKEFIIPNCPHLEALHVLDCGMSFHILHHILMHAPKLTILSWSLWDITSEDIEFIVKSIESSEGICLKSIKRLRLQIVLSFPHIQIAKYLLLSCFRELEELEIHIWVIDEAYGIDGWNFPVPIYEFIPGFPQPSVENELQHLHSLVFVAVGSPLFSTYVTYKNELSDFVSVLSRKSSSTKWKKVWILPLKGICQEHLTDLLLALHPDDFQSVEAFGAYTGKSANAVDKLKTFFERIGDNTVRSLHLCLPCDSNPVVEICELILRVGGHSLKFLNLSVNNQIHPKENMSIHSLFSKCSNITELDLLDCYFAKDICEPLSKLKHLTKVQLMECAISSKHCKKTRVGISKANLLTFVENCQNITHFEVHGCCYHLHFSCCLTDDDLFALAKLRNLESLTLKGISGIREWTFLQNISEHCKLLTMLRISAWKHFKTSHIPILIESAKFLKHLAISVDVPLLGSEVFWNLLSHAKNLQRLCIISHYKESLNIPIAVETLKSLSHLHMLHLHSYKEDFYDKIIRVLEKKEPECRFSFEIVTGKRKDTWINHQTGYTLISNKALPLNEAELCDMRPALDIPRF